MTWTYVAESSPNDIISVKDLTKSFKDLKAVDNISFSVKKGEIFAFLGPNGAGKSTTIKMLTTILHPTSGEIILNGFNTVKNPKDVRKSFGIIFQDHSLDEDLTAYENMQLHGVFYNVPEDVAKERIQKLLEVTELWDRKDDFVKNFSGGMKRRLEIARGLLHHPKIFFLDEPTVGLDPQTRNHIWDYIKELNKTENITIFFTTHYMDEAARYATRIAVIDHGKIITEGTAQHLLDKTGKTNLEDAFISLTGHSLRVDEASSVDKLRNARKRMVGMR